MTEQNFPALFHFFGCYLHQDWELEFSDWRDAARTFILEEPRSQVEETRRELRQLIDCDYDPEMLGRVLLSLCCYFDPKGLGLSDLEFLKELQQQLAF